MKRIFTLIFFVPFAIMLIAGCVKKPADDTQGLLPYGNFSGLFSRIRYNSKTKKYDTIKANVNIALDAQRGVYALTGDTAIVHAGSRGTYAADAFGIAFNDATIVNADGIKVHLHGGYLYTFDGAVFNMQAVQDTLKFVYNLKAK